MAWKCTIYVLFTLNVNFHALKVQDLVRFKFAQFSHGVQDAGAIQDAVGIELAIYNVTCGQCLSACSTQKECAFVNYRRLIHQCRLVSKDEKDQLPVTIDQTGSIFVDKENIDATSVPSKCDRCNDGQICDKTTGACTTIECPKPDVRTGRVYGNVRSVGSRLVFACDAGGDGNKLMAVTCKEDGQWSSDPSCIHTVCSQPPTIPNTIRTTLPNMFHVTYTCDIGNDYYDINYRKEVTIECDVRTGQWTDPGIECVKDCPDPPEIINTDSLTTANSPGSVTTFRCLYGNRLEFKATCQGTNGTWTGLQDCSTDDGCDEYLVEQIPDSSLTASTYYGNDEFYAPHHARLTPSGIGGWVPKVDDQQPYIQAVFKGLKHVVGIITMGIARNDFIQFVKTYTVSYSRRLRQNCDEYFVQQDGAHKIFDGNSDKTSKKYNYLPEPLSVRCIRLYPQTFESHIALRFDVIGCDDRCTTYLVSRAYGVSDASLTASSFYVDGNGKSAGPEHARLYNVDTPTHYGGWGVNSWGNNYIQVRLRRPQRVSGIVTKGMNNLDSWVTQYHVAYSSDSDCNMTSWIKIDRIFSGNNDSDTRVTRVLSQIINAVCVRIYPLTLVDFYWTARTGIGGITGMRFDLKGCVDYVCPESPERFITSSIDSNLAVRLMTGSYTKAEAQRACADAGTQLVILGSGEKENIVLNMTRGCSMYAEHEFWVDGELKLSKFLFSDGSSRAANLPIDPTTGGIPRDYIAHPCLALSDKGGDFPIYLPDCLSKRGYICEYKMEETVK